MAIEVVFIYFCRISGADDVCLTAADVVLRYAFNSPISGDLELVEFMMAILVPFALAYAVFRFGLVF